MTKPQYMQVSDITYAQVDSWYDHCRRDLKLDLIYPEDMSDKRYPCIVWTVSYTHLDVYKRQPLSLVASGSAEHSRETARDNLEEGGDDVKSSCPL